MFKAFLAFFVRLAHIGRHNYDKRYLDMPAAIWPMKAPYLEICDCGSVRLRDDS